MFVHLVLDGVADGPLGVALDVVHTAARLIEAGVVVAPAAPRQRVVSIDGHPVRSGAGRRVDVDDALAPRASHRGDVVVLAGLGAATERELEVLLARPDVQRALPLLAGAAARGAIVAASCSATFVLAASGLLDGRRATTTGWLARPFARLFPAVQLAAERMVVEDGGVVTAGSALGHADLMLALVARTHGPSLARAVARYLVLDERMSQARYAIGAHLASADPTVVAVERLVLANLARQVSIAEMARAAAVSPRTLARRVEAALGTTPRRFARRLRMMRAVHLLDTTRDNVERVAARVGYADAAAFRRNFVRELGEAPRTRRREPTERPARRRRSGLRSGAASKKNLVRRRSGSRAGGPRRPR